MEPSTIKVKTVAAATNAARNIKHNRKSLKSTMFQKEGKELKITPTDETMENMKRFPVIFKIWIIREKLEKSHEVGTVNKGG